MSTVSDQKGIKVLLTLSTARGERECKTEGIERRGAGISDEQVARNGSETRSVQAVLTCPKRETIPDATAQALVATTGYGDGRRGMTEKG